VGYGSLKSDVEAEVTRRDLDDIVDIVDTRASGSFHPFFNEVVRDHDVFVLPSLRTADGDDEGGPALVLVCAQAGGMPCVTTPFPGSERSVIDGVTGVLSGEGDVDSLVDRLEWVLDHPERWADIGTAASELVRREFSLDGQLSALEAHYRQVIDR
jgi:colanic acid/amylovoran biosynthesis glycosyltransferase